MSWSQKGKSVGVVCSTYRKPGEEPLVRLYGVVSLFDQMMKQSYDGDIKIALVDDSAEPHPFYMAVAEKYKDRLVYVHIPSRDTAASEMHANYPQASKFVPSNAVLATAYSLDLAERLAKGGRIIKAELKIAGGDFNLSPSEWDQVVGKINADYVSDKEAAQLQMTLPVSSANPLVNFWKARIGETRSFARFLPFEADYPIQTNLFSQMFLERPAIGMKKNVGVQALAEAFGKFDAVVFADDDDHHSPDYVRQSVAGLEDHDFARMMRYLTLRFNKEASQQRWGEYDLPITPDNNGYWVLPPDVLNQAMICNHPDGTLFEKSIGSKFSRPVMMAWPTISHDGALHSYSFNAWERSVEKFGGAIPTSFCEDIIYYRMMQDRLDGGVKARVVPVDAPSFIRIADGGNASVIEWMRTIETKDVPLWAQQALAPLNAAVQVKNTPHSHILRRLGETYAATGALDLSLIADTQPMLTVNPARNRQIKLA
jgi:hypothetical protein